MFSSYPKEARQLLTGCWLAPPSKCRQNNAQIWETVKDIFDNYQTAKVAREWDNSTTGKGSRYQLQEMTADESKRQQPRYRNDNNTIQGI